MFDGVENGGFTAVFVQLRDVKHIVDAFVQEVQFTLNALLPTAAMTRKSPAYDCINLSMEPNTMSEQRW